MARDEKTRKTNKKKPSRWNNFRRYAIRRAFEKIGRPRRGRRESMSSVPSLSPAQGSLRSVSPTRTDDAFLRCDLTDKVAIVTGGSGRVGTEIALVLAKRGANVIINGRNEPKLELVKDLFHQEGLDHPTVVVGDIESPEVRQKIVESTLSKYGRIDILVSNAEKTGSYLSLELTLPAYLSDMMRVHVEWPFELVKLVMPELIKTKGNIVFTSSIVAGTGLSNGIAYAASKAAQSNMMKSIASAQVYNGVRCNAVNPALHKKYLPNVSVRIDGPGPSEGADYVCEVASLRECKANDIAQMVAFLVSDAASFITGQEHYVDGGQTACYTRLRWAKALA